MGAQRFWRHFHRGGNFALIKMKKKYDKSSEIRATVFNPISVAAFIKFYDFFMHCAYSRAMLIKINLKK